MILTEELTINGRSFIRTYSSAGYLVERDGAQYAQAIDPAELGRVYTETDRSPEVSMEDQARALRELGVQV